MACRVHVCLPSGLLSEHTRPMMLHVVWQAAPGPNVAAHVCNTGLAKQQISSLPAVIHVCNSIAGLPSWVGRGSPQRSTWCPASWWHIQRHLHHQFQFRHHQKACVSLLFQASKAEPMSITVQDPWLDNNRMPATVQCC